MKQQIEWVPISTPKPYPNNPRINKKAIEVVKQSIREYGFRNPILIDKHDVIINGHTRIEAAYQLGMKKVPVLRAPDLTQAQVKGLRLMDNKSSEYSTWDKELLKSELEDLNKLEFPEDLTGFTTEELDITLNRIKQDEAESVKKLGHIEITCPKCKHRFKKSET